MELENWNGKTNILPLELSRDDAVGACCGKVLITRKRMLLIHCSFCQKNFGCFNDFVDHLSTQHYQHMEDENMFAKESDDNAVTQFVCNSFDGSREQEIDYEEFSQIQRFAEVVIKPDYKEIQEEYFEEIEEVLINNAAYCDEKSFDGKLKSSEISDKPDKEDEEMLTDVDLELENKIVDDIETTNLDKILDNFVGKSTQDKENYDMETDYGEHRLNDKDEPSTMKEFPQIKYKNTTPEKIFKCNICNKKFLHEKRLKKHYIIHSEERKHKCHICEFAFKDISNLRAHLKRHTNQKNINCEICSKKFFTRSEAIQHQRCHTGERPFICTNCGLSFITSGALTFHAKRHKAEAAYKCDHCEKGFYGRADFKDHMLVHTKEKPHICHVCGVSFPRHKSLLRHARLHAKLA